MRHDNFKVNTSVRYRSYIELFANFENSRLFDIGQLFWCFFLVLLVQLLSSPRHSFTLRSSFSSSIQTTPCLSPLIAFALCLSLLFSLLNRFVLESNRLFTSGILKNFTSVMILLLLSSLRLPIYHKMYLDLWYHFRLRNMSTFNQTSSYNRTYERKVVEEAPRIRVTTQTHQPFSPVMIPASYFPSFHFAPTSLSSSGSPTTLGTGGTVTSLRTSSDSFQATLDVSLFAPEDLKVNIILHHRFWWSVLGVPIQVQV